MPKPHSWLHCPPAHPLIEAIPALRDNYFWLVSNAEGGAATVVDPGEAAPVQAALAARGLRLGSILLTHHHADHAGGVPALVRHWDCEVFGPAREAIPGVTRPLSAGDRFVPAGLATAFEVIDVPGHTRGHVAYVADAHGDDPRPVLFCGDTLFAAGCGRLFEGTPAQMLASLDRLAALAPETLAYCAHEYTAANLRFALAADPGSAQVAQRNEEALRMRSAGLATVPTSIAIERATNPFLRCDSSGIMASLTIRMGNAPSDRVAAFAALRAWKDGFA